MNLCIKGNLRSSAASNFQIIFTSSLRMGMSIFSLLLDKFIVEFPLIASSLASHILKLWDKIFKVIKIVGWGFKQINNFGRGTKYFLINNAQANMVARNQKEQHFPEECSGR